MTYLHSCHRTSLIQYKFEYHRQNNQKRQKYRYHKEDFKNAFCGKRFGKVVLVGSITLMLSNDESVKKLPEKYSGEGYFNLDERTVLERLMLPFFICMRIVQIVFYFAPVVLMVPFVVLMPRLFEGSWWSLMRCTLSNLGGCWIKLGQWASTRPDIFNRSMIEKVSSLCHNCPAHSFKHSKREIENDFGQSLDDIFEEFEEEPYASGAIGQVHLAKMNDGQSVIVKIVHPSVRYYLKTDLYFMKFFSNIITLFAGNIVDMNYAFDEFMSNMVNQLDMRFEAANLYIFNKNFQNDDRIFFPTVIEPYVSKNVLIETFEIGQSIDGYMGKPPNALTKVIAELGIDAYLKMVLVHNFIHADLHPGNILVRPNPSNDKIELVFLDVGLITIFEDKDWIDFKSLFKSIVNGDGEIGAELMLSNAPGGPVLLSPEDADEFKHKMNIVFTGVRHKKMSNIYLSEILNDVFALAREYKVPLKSNIATLVVGTAVMEGIGRTLSPELDLLNRSVPILVKNFIWNN